MMKKCQKFDKLWASYYYWRGFKLWNFISKWHRTWDTPGNRLSPYFSDGRHTYGDY